MGSEAVKISVVIAAYNAANTIRQSIESCLQQSHLPHEIIVVDDASTDNTKDVVLAFGDAVKCIQLLQNCGSAAARNKGMDSATGNYIAFLDADDAWHTRKLEIVSSILTAQSGMQFLYHSYTLNELRDVAIPPGATLYQTPFIKFLLGNPVATPCAVVKNDKAYRFESSMRYMEDYDLWLRIAYKHKAYFIDVPLTQIGRPVLSPGGVSAHKWQMRKGELKTFRRLLKLNPLFILLLPFLYCYSLGKHLYKSLTGS